MTTLFEAILLRRELSKANHPVKKPQFSGLRKKGQDNRHKTEIERQLRPVFTSTETKEALTWEEW